MTERVRWADERRPIVVTALLFVVGATAPLLTVSPFVQTYEARLGVFAATMIVHLVAFGHVVSRARRWMRPECGPQLLDFVLATAPGLSAVLAFVLMRDAYIVYGTSGELPPLYEYGLPTDLFDLIYLGAIAAILAAMVGAIGLVLLLARSQLLARSVARMATKSPSDTPRWEPVTSAADSFWRRVMSPATWVVFGLCALFAAPGLWLIAADPEGKLGPVGWLVLLVGIPATAWAVLQSIWRPDEQWGVLMAAVIRSAVVPVITALPLGLLNLVIGLLPPFSARIEQHQIPDDVYLGHEWFPLEEDGLVFQFLVQGTMGGFVMSMLAGIAITVFVVFPARAFWNPAQAIKDSMMSTKTADGAANIAEIRALALGLPLAFVIPALMVEADSDDFRWWLGVALIPIGLALGYYVWSRQRVDHQARADLGVSGVPNPSDPLPPNR